jgi:hypothetical protein
MLDGAKAAATTLKSAQSAGKELGSVVTSQQADMENSVQKEHQARMRAQLAEKARKATLEYRALAKFEDQMRHERDIAKLKAETIHKYGKDAWVKVEAEKALIEKERQAELTAMDHDRQKQNDVLCWCMTVAALITYFFQLYKL